MRLRLRLIHLCRKIQANLVLSQVELSDPFRKSHERRLTGVDAGLRARNEFFPLKRRRKTILASGQSEVTCLDVIIAELESFSQIFDMWQLVWFHESINAHVSINGTW